jgi:hypothetical protein
VSSIYEFINNCKDSHLTLGDVRALNKGDKLDAVIWHDAFIEYGKIDKVEKNLKQNTLFKPRQLFECLRCTIEYLGNFEWNIYFNDDPDESYQHPVHVLETLPGIFGNDYDFKKNISSAPDNYRAGFRGPIILWSKLKTMDDNLILIKVY